MERMNRRTIIKGASATVAAIAMPAIASANNDTETLAHLIARHKTMHRAMTYEGRKVDALDLQLNASAPAMPPELTPPIAVEGDKRLTAGNSNTGWTIEELDSRLASATYFKCTRTDLPSGGWTLECVDLPLPSKTLSLMRRIRSARESYDAAVEAHFEPFAKRQAEWEASIDDVDAALSEVIAFQATSWATLHQKTDYLRNVEAFADGTDTDTALEIAESLVTDILTLTASA